MDEYDSIDARAAEDEAEWRHIQECKEEIRLAVLAEREACAQIADEQAENPDGYDYAAENIAKRIRERGTTNVKPTESE